MCSSEQIIRWVLMRRIIWTIGKHTTGVGGVLSVTGHKSGQADRIRCFFDLWVRDTKKSRDKIRGPGSGMNIPDLIFECWSGSGIRDGKIGSGIRDKHPESATRDSPIYCNHSRTVFSNFLDQQFDTVLHKLITVTQIILNNFFPWKFPSHTIDCVFLCQSHLSGLSVGSHAS